MGGLWWLLGPADVVDRTDGVGADSDPDSGVAVEGAKGSFVGDGVGGIVDPLEEQADLPPMFGPIVM